jgi:hypothetical protein
VLVSTLVLARSNFYKAFILDVEWFAKGIVVILLQKDGRRECVIAYANKGLSIVQ